MLALCESRYHIFKDYRPKDLRGKKKSEKSEKGVGLLEKIITTMGEPPIRKKARLYAVNLKSCCLDAWQIRHIFIISHAYEIIFMGMDN